ncbi:O-antigen ligase-related family protein [Alteracholeplasma palmae J233]|uniref:O-antigen ligase-related family protein n=1 Tax=Alteracholeplasma palmae (strain ATCC 49389 / J233) TaxID=1318466 RepID=U4KS64_ALTPJ|nr:O-antigen ligase family protein [Alteracholeplasma palmae]CCV64761.1 O-antigen ligase-related family protein [Alteracholeplasma palmae J233]
MTCNLKKSNIESFFNSYYYIASVALISYIIWLLRFFVHGESLYVTTFSLILLLGIVFGSILILFKNTVYTVPIALSLLFTIGIAGMNLETFSTTSLVIVGIAIATIILSIIAHLIIYKPSFKLNTFGISYILVGVSFIIPFIYRGINSHNMIGFLGVIYLIIYLFYSNTIKKDNTNYLFRTLFILSLMLSFQLIACFIDNLSHFEGKRISDALIFLLKGGTDPGWGNTNDLTIHLTLFSASTIYYMYKYPKKYFPWLHLLFTSFVIVLSGARGSMVTSVALWLIILIITIRNRKLGSLKSLYITLGSIAIFLGIFYNFTYEVIESFIASLKGGTNQMLTGRLDLYELAIEAFKKYPIFGSGWGDLQPEWLGGGTRIIVYHSTFFHALAIGGIFGILVLGYQLYATFKFLLKPTYLAKFVILITYIVTQVHGLFDNTQYMVNYTLSTIIIFSILEAYDASKKTEESTL